MTDSNKAVFLSYASHDGEAAQDLCNALRAAGIEVWFDQNELRGGDAWDALIRRQIRGCYLFVPMISANTQAREEGYFRREWKIAVDRTNDMAEDRAFLLPVVIDGTSDSQARVPERFREVQWTRLSAGASTDAFVENVRRLLEPDAVMRAATSARPSALPLASIQATSIRSTSPTSRSFVPLIVGALLVFLLGYFVVDKFWLSRRVLPVAPTAAPVALVAMPVAPAIPEQSVAVLPFLDLSEKHDQEYFSDGLSEELIDRLVKISGLRIPARTSSFYFKGKQITMKDIAAALGVAHVLEGSVRKSGTTLRITAQLIRVDSGYHLWSETYDRQFTDIFKIQDEISAAIVKALNLALNPSVPGIATAANVEANDLYLRSRALTAAMTKNSVERELDLLRQALKLDPKFARAWASLSRSIAYSAQLDYQLDQKKSAVALGEARSAAERAVALEPSLADGHLALGRIYLFDDRDNAKAKREIELALSLEPGNSDAVLQRGNIASQEGRFDEALPLYLRAHDLDPLNANNMVVLSEFYVSIGDGASAEQLARKLGKLYPANRYWMDDLAVALALQGKVKEALDALDAGAEDEYDHLLFRAMFYPALGRAADGDAALAHIETSNAKNVLPMDLAAVYAYRGNKDRAYEWLDRQYAADSAYLASTLDLNFAFIPLRGEERFNVLRHKLNLPDLHFPVASR